MRGYYVTWNASGVTYVEANSSQDAITIFDNSPGDFIDVSDSAFAEYADAVRD